MIGDKIREMKRDGTYPYSLESWYVGLGNPMWIASMWSSLVDSDARTAKFQGLINCFTVGLIGVFAIFAMFQNPPTGHEALEEAFSSFIYGGGIVLIFAFVASLINALFSREKNFGIYPEGRLEKFSDFEKKAFQFTKFMGRASFASREVLIKRGILPLPHPFWSGIWRSYPIGDTNLRRLIQAHFIAIAMDILQLCEDGKESGKECQGLRFEFSLAFDWMKELGIFCSRAEYKGIYKSAEAALAGSQYPKWEDLGEEFLDFQWWLAIPIEEAVKTLEDRFSTAEAIAKIRKLIASDSIKILKRNGHERISKVDLEIVHSSEY